MRRATQDTLLLLFGMVMLRVGVTDLHLRFVKAQMQPLIVLAAVCLVAIGTAGLVGLVREASARRQAGADAPDAPDPPAAHDHHEGHGVPRAAWLLALPLFVLLLVAPPPLGADAVQRSASTTLPPEDTLPALPPAVDGVVDLTISEYSQRALYVPASVHGARVKRKSIGWSC